jgi:hypothetical protein
MGIFKKTIKYSKPSKDLDSKIKNLDEELKQTGVIIDKNNDESLCIQESSVQELPDIYDQIPVEREEEKLYDWRESFLTEENNNEFLEEENDYKSITKVETYISESNRQLIEIRDQIFDEISKSTLLNLPEIKYKIERVLEIYDEIHEGLLNEPPEIKNEDPLTPINQNFVTIDELNRHYTLFINRVQEQLATIGGGGETKLKYLDDIVGIATNASSYDGKFLKYDHSLGKFVFETVSGGGGGGGATGDYASIAGFATYASNVGFATFAGVAGFATNATRAGISTFATLAGTSGFSTVSSVAGFSTVAAVAGFATNATRAGLATLTPYSYAAGFSTVSTVAGVATFATISAVSGFSTVSSISGFSTVAGYASTAGIASALSSTASVNTTGVITASSFSGSGSNLTGLTGASANTYGNGTSVPQIVVDANGRITSITNVAISGGGGGGSGVFVNNGSLVGFAGTINFNPNTFAVTSLSAGIVTATVIAAPNAGFATFARWSGISTIASVAGFSSVATHAGVSTVSSVAGFATYATSAGVSTLSQGLTGTPNVTVGIITATRFVGSGISLTGIVTSITAGSGISINQSTGNVTITATGGGSQTLDQTLALGNSSSRGMSVGVLTATSFSGDGSTLTNILVRDVNGNLIAGQGAGDGAALPATASNNVIIGNNAAGNTLDPSFLGDENVFIGQESGYFVTSGAQNVLVGLYAGYQIREGNTNVYLGKDAGRNTKSGDNNVSIGHYSGELNDTGNNNVFVGSFTGISTDASSKVIIGSGGGSGFNFDAPAPSKNIQLAIGVKVDAITPTGYWIVGDENFNVGIGTTNPKSKLDVVGNAKFIGVVTATSFVGDGSQLTGISASGSPSIDLLEVMLFS